MAGSDTRVARGDVIYVMGEFEDVARFAREYGAEMINRKTSEDTDSLLKSKLKFDEIGIAEMLLMRNSDLINMPVKSSGLRAKYGVNILTIQRDNHYIFHNLKDVKLQYGDTLLIQGTWTDIARLSEKTFEWVVVGQPLAEASKVTLTHKAPWPQRHYAADDCGHGVQLGARCGGGIDCRRPDGVVRLSAQCGGGVPDDQLGEHRADCRHAADVRSAGEDGSLRGHFPRAGGRTGGFGPFALMAGVYFTASLLTMFISNTATAVLLAPIALQSAASMGISPYPLLLAVSVGTSMCFASPFSTPPNALVMPAGKYTFMDYVKVGVPLQVIMGLYHGSGDSAIFPVREGLTGGVHAAEKGAWPGEFACIAKKKERQPGRAGVEKDYSRTPFNHEVFAYCSGRCFRHAFHGGGRRSQENDFCGKESRPP